MFTEEFQWVYYLNCVSFYFSSIAILTLNIKSKLHTNTYLHFTFNANIKKTLTLKR